MKHLLILVLAITPFVSFSQNFEWVLITEDSTEFYVKLAVKDTISLDAEIAIIENRITIVNAAIASLNQEIVDFEEFLGDDKDSQPAKRYKRTIRKEIKQREKVIKDLNKLKRRTEKQRGIAKRKADKQKNKNR